MRDLVAQTVFVGVGIFVTGKPTEWNSYHFTQYTQRTVMKDENLSKVVTMQMPLGHILLAWETLSDKFSDLRSNDTLSEEERRAIWGLADLLEKALAENGVDNRPDAEWAALVGKAKEFIKTIHVDCLD